MNFYKKNINFTALFLFMLLVALATISILGKHAKARIEDTTNNQVFVDYHYLLSFVDLYNGDINTALFNYKKVLPYLKNLKFYNEYSDMLLYAKKYNKAEIFLKNSIKIFPDSRKLYAKLLDIFIIKKENKEAIKFIKNNKNIFGNNTDMYKKLAILYMRDANYPKAIEYFKKTSDYESNGKTLYYIAQCYKAMNKLEDAIKYTKRLLKQNNSNLSSKMFLANLYEQTKQYKKAIDIYKNMNIQQDIKFSLIGNDFYLSSNLHKAFLYFKKAYLINNSVIYAEKAAYMLMRLGEYENVIRFIDNNKVPLTSDKIKYFYGVSLMSEKQYKKAIDVFKKIGPSSLLYKDVLYNEVVCYSKLNRKKEAFQVLETVKNKDEDIYYMIADLYLRYKEYNKAISTIDNNINVFKNRSKAYFYVADVYYDKLKNKERAIKYLNMSLKINPKNANVLNYLGYLYINENIDIKKGIELVKRALKIQPDDSYYLDSLAWGYYKSGQYKKAVILLKRAIANKKRVNLFDDSVIKIHLAKVYLKTGKIDKAKNILREVIRKFPKNKEAKRLFNNLK